MIQNSPALELGSKLGGGNCCLVPPRRPTVPNLRTQQPGSPGDVPKGRGRAKGHTARGRAEVVEEALLSAPLTHPYGGWKAGQVGFLKEP